jgi:hypothetical protein
MIGKMIEIRPTLSMMGDGPLLLTEAERPIAGDNEMG